MYVRDIKAGTTNRIGEPSVIKESGATALVDGNNLLGDYIYKLRIVDGVEIFVFDR